MQILAKKYCPKVDLNIIAADSLSQAAQEAVTAAGGK